MVDVMHVITGLGRGGAETTLVQLALGLEKRGVVQHIVSLTQENTFADELRHSTTKLTTLDASKLLTTAALAKLVNRLRPKMLQGWMYHGNLAATLAHVLASGRSGRDLFWNVRASNMDEARYGGVIRASALLSRLPKVVIANSEAGAGFHRKKGFREKRLVVIDNGIDTHKFCPDPIVRRQMRQELGIADDVPVVICVGRVDPMKDQANFLRAMSQLPSVTAIVVGKDTKDLTVPKNVRTLGLRHDIDRLFTIADVVVSSSAFGEGFSNVIAEGMSTGLVPVATDVGDARRIVGDTGIVVPARDSGALAQAIANATALPGDERSRRGALARERIVANFSLDRSIERYFQLYRGG